MQRLMKGALSNVLLYELTPSVSYCFILQSIAQTFFTVLQTTDIFLPWWYDATFLLINVFSQLLNIQADEDHEDLDDRWDPDSDTEMDDTKHADEQILYCAFYF